MRIAVAIFGRGRTRAQTRPLQQQNTDGLIAMLGPSKRAPVYHALVAEQVQKSSGLPMCTLKEVVPEPTSYAAACKSQYAVIWKKPMESEFAGLVAAEAFVVSEVPNDCNIMEALTCKWKCYACDAINKT